MPRKYRMPRHAVTQPSDPSYRLIPLTRNKNATVDAEDFDFLNQWNWCAHYDPKSGRFTAVKRAASGKCIKMHRFILSCSDDEEVDHANHDSLDNRRNNLRKCTRAENTRNQRISTRNKSGYKGVSWSAETNKWYSCIGFKGKTIAIGIFRTRKQAAHAYDAAAKRLHGEFAHLNFPNC